MSIPAAERAPLTSRQARDAFAASLGAPVPPVGSDRWIFARSRLTPAVLDAMALDGAAEMAKRERAVKVLEGLQQAIVSAVASILGKVAGKPASQVVRKGWAALDSGSAADRQAWVGLLSQYMPFPLAYYYQIRWDPAIKAARVQAADSRSWVADPARAYLAQMGELRPASVPVASQAQGASAPPPAPAPEAAGSSAPGYIGGALVALAAVLLWRMR